MAGLFSVSTEILYRIIDQLPRSSLASFCRTSKVARSIAEPLLYRQIEWNFPHDGDQDGTKDRHPIHLFFRTICQRPALANHVKTAVLLSGADPTDWDLPLSLCPAPLDVSPLWLDSLGRQRLPPMDDHTAQQYRLETQTGNPGALVGILLASLPRLETLAVDYTLMRQSDLPDNIIKSLQALKEVTIRNNLDSRIINNYERFAKLGSVFYLSGLERLSTVFQAVKDTSVAHADLPALRTLELTDHFAHASAIRELLTKTPKLEALSYFLVEDMDYLTADANGFHTELHEDEWAAFAQVLGSVAGSLKTLKISVDMAATTKHTRYIMDEEWVFGISTRRGGIGSLSHLENLAKLEIPMYLILGRSPHQTRLQDVLPPSLKKLYLRDDYVFDEDLNNCEPAVVLPILESYIVEKDTNNTFLLQELRIKLRLREFDSQSDDNLPGIKGIFGFIDQPNLARFETMGRRAGVKCTIHLRASSSIVIDKGCVDEVNELVMYDPNVTEDGNGTERKEKGQTAYLRGQIHKRARCFMSNWE